MITGIVETTGEILSFSDNGTNRTFWVKSSLADTLKVDQSVAHNGVCLTVEAIENGAHQITAVEETLNKTNLYSWSVGSPINLERCMLMNARIDGHLVQGHVDTTATCTARSDKNGSWEFSFNLDESFAPLIIEKGSISLNGTSLTIFNVTKNAFTVAVIPYTFEHTNIHAVHPGDAVNIEFDMIGKYVSRIAALKP